MKISDIICCFINIFLLSIIFVSCARDLSNENESDAIEHNLNVEWNVAFEMSRTVINDDGSGHFENGDAIIVCASDVENDNIRQFTIHFEDGKWFPEICWKEIGNDVVFTAWHLPSGLLTGTTPMMNYVHSILDKQQDGGYEKSDLLFANTRARIGEKVNLRFKHALSRLNLILESRDASFSDEQLSRAEIEIYTPVRVPFDLYAGSLLQPYDYKWITPVRKGSNLWSALLCPQDTDELRSEGWIRINIDGDETIVNLPEDKDGKTLERLEAGKQIIYRINLRKKNTADEFAGTTRWVYGVNESEPGQWKQNYTQLMWTENCGWFDCNKINPSGTSSADDGLMCWAASASNLIHWWLRQNADTDAVKAYSGPSAVPVDMLHSDIFQLFKNNFPNQGEYPIKAINWFFNGVFHRKIYDTDSVDPKAGFFRQQLGINSLGREYDVVDMVRERFNSIIKQALTSRQGILFVIDLGRKWSKHAVVLWGVKFDDDGMVDTLYMVDNNDGRDDKRGTIRVMKVEYLPFSETNRSLYPYVQNSLGDFTIRIESLCTLSLGREWIK